MSHRAWCARHLHGFGRISWQTGCMPDVRETNLPGIGVRHDFTTADGTRIGVLVRRDGRREILVYDRKDPDACSERMQLSASDTQTLSELLGAGRVTEAVTAVRQQIEGLAIEWIDARHHVAVDRPHDRRRAVADANGCVGGGRHPRRHHRAGAGARLRVRTARRRRGRRHRRRPGDVAFDPRSTTRSLIVLAAGSSEAALAFIEIGAVVLALAILSRFAGRIGITAVPLYLIAGLVVGEGGVVTLDVSEEFISLAAEIGVLLLLLALGLEYNEAELRTGLRTGLVPGVTDMVLNAVPGVVLGLLLGWTPLAAVLLGGVCWVSSSGIISKVLSDLGRLGFRETPTVLNMLVIEDLAMAVYLPVVARVDRRRNGGGTVGERGAGDHRRRRGPRPRRAIRQPPQRRRRRRLERVAAADGVRAHAPGRRVGAADRGVGGDRRLSRRPRPVGPRRGARRRLDRAAERPVRRHVLRVLLVPDRSVRPRRRRPARPRPRHRHVARQGRHRVDRGRASGCRTPRTGAGRHGADRPRRVLDRDRRPRLRARRRARPRCARGRLRVDHRDRRPARDEVRRPIPIPARLAPPLRAERRAPAPWSPVPRRRGGR